MSEKNLVSGPVCLDAGTGVPAEILVDTSRRAEYFVLPSNFRRRGLEARDSGCDVAECGRKS